MRGNVKKTKVVICGGSGYTGIELIRLLSSHPCVAIGAITSEKSAGHPVAQIFPHLQSVTGLVYEPLDPGKLLTKGEVFFLALPHGASQETVKFFFRHGKTVIDLSADFRLKDAAVYSKWYGMLHPVPGLLKKAVYGLPEVYRKRIARAKLIANPGCYPTSAILGLLPALRARCIDIATIVVDSKSGTSGAGRKADVSFSFCEVNEGFKAYGVGAHRHTPEIEQELSAAAGTKLVVNFTPHLLPVDRGILTTIYAKLSKRTDTAAMLRIYRKKYADEPFVRVMPEGTWPNIMNVRGTNFCDIGLKVVERTNTLIVVSAIDNLVKGASGQAVQNMNLALGLDETTGLGLSALIP